MFAIWPFVFSYKALLCYFITIVMGYEYHDKKWKFYICLQSIWNNTNIYENGSDLQVHWLTRDDDIHNVCTVCKLYKFILLMIIASSTYIRL